jgi:putative membrane protein
MFLIKFILRWIAMSASVWVTSQIIGGVGLSTLKIAFIVGAVILLFNLLVKPIINILTLPLNIITLGLFSLVVNSALFWYLGKYIEGFTVDKFSTAFIGAILVYVIGFILNKIFRLD